MHDSEPASLRGARVVLADDDELVRTVYAEALRRHGCEVAEAADGAAGVSLARLLRPALVLLDLRMPGTDGWEALRALRADPGTAALVVVALTGEASQTTRRRALDAGFDAFVEKVFTPAALVRALEAALADARARRGGGAASGSSAAALSVALPILLG